MKTVLFVCVGNTFRSVMAEAMFNASPPPGWRAESAGTQKGGTVSPAAIELLGAIGLRPGDSAPRQVTPEMVERADRVITFGCLQECPPGTAGKATDWNIPGGMDSTPAERRVIRDNLLLRVEALKSVLAGSGH